ncbi:sensor histidine kinase [Polynucleobacter sp. UB-Raua-W9]|uniref:sensor histidine kinase n=1 Tax=Polynucleobacter sp. UB-Raua-W9 TaxID=1819736 RepID=UPI001BFEDD78|nr:ATP-binding protein [Polynucleobacter sp. UB-Raua-W9]QWD72397.1 GHKL domain-containing protein [Polynucleobacter sp. UB-Raua-W9]
MKYANELFFAALSLIMWGLVFGSKYLISAKKIIQPEGFWYLALILEASSFTFFAIAPAIEIKLLTLANTCLLGGYIYLASYCRSLSQPISRQFKWGILLAVLTIGLIFEYLMQRGTFVQRVGFVMVLTDLAIIWQLLELKRLHKFRIDLPTFLIFTMVGELIFVTTRLVILIYIDPPSFIHLYDEPTLTAAVRWILFSLTTFSYIAIIGHSLKKITIENTQTIRENQKITELLKEKERLIYGLLKANKTVATGALSASIAHELNQPLGASSLNIQFLKMKLEKGALNPELGKEILDSLEVDNQRAATIVKSLRSIFTESDSSAEEVQLGDLISKVLDIVKPELKSKNIQIQLQVDDDLVIKVNPAEMVQVILNLVNNAVQALANSGTLQRRISIEAVKAGKLVQLSVSDNGTGVSPEFKPQLFELLSTTKQTGMGLGLWLCRHIITRYGGSIVYEDADSGGAKFSMQLPSLV